MSPPSATDAVAPPADTRVQTNAKPLIQPSPPSYEGVDPLVVRQELKEKLAAAFRIFARYVAPLTCLV